jgi:hypothetical protein
VTTQLATGRPDTPALERALGALIEQRSDYAYASSHPLERLVVRDSTGHRQTILFKDSSPRARRSAPAAIKPRWLYDPKREPLVYQELLAPAGLGTPALVGAAPARGWLFLELVGDAVELYQVGDLGVWQAAARWLGGAHTRLSRACPRLLTHDADWHWRWARRAVAFSSDRVGPGAAEHRALERLIAGYGRVVERLLAQPRVVIHGEFYPANVLVQVEPNGHVRRVCPVDWEMTAVGSALTDLAALCTGWSSAGREALATAYAQASDGQYTNSERVLVDLDWCRLALAVQWLGWSPGWLAPASQAHDWIGETLALAQWLGV